VHVIGHQPLGVHTAFEALGQFFEVAQVNPIVFLGEEAGNTVISPLNDVQGGRPQISDMRAVAFCYLAGLYLSDPTRLSGLTLTSWFALVIFP
jgi:hypothetical protein